MPDFAAYGLLRARIGMLSWARSTTGADTAASFVGSRVDKIA